MAIRIECACGALFDLDESLAGQTVECEQCHGQFVVPQPVSTEVAPALTVSRLGQIKVSRKMVLVVVALLSICGVYVLWGRGDQGQVLTESDSPRGDDSAETDEEKAKENANIWVDSNVEADLLADAHPSANFDGWCYEEGTWSRSEVGYSFNIFIVYDTTVHGDPETGNVVQCICKTDRLGAVISHKWGKDTGALSARSSKWLRDLANRSINKKLGE